MCQLATGILITVLGKHVNSNLGTCIERVPALDTVVVSISDRIISPSATYFRTPTPQHIGVVNGKQMSDMHTFVVVDGICLTIQRLFHGTQNAISINILSLGHIVD